MSTYNPGGGGTCTLLARPKRNREMLLLNCSCWVVKKREVEVAGEHRSLKAPMVEEVEELRLRELETVSDKLAARIAGHKEPAHIELLRWHNRHTPHKDLCQDFLESMQPTVPKIHSRQLAHWDQQRRQQGPRPKACCCRKIPGRCDRHNLHHIHRSSDCDHGHHGRHGHRILGHQSCHLCRHNGLVAGGP